MKENKELEKNELTEAISSASSEIAAADGISDEEELRRLRKIQLIKMGVIAALSAIIMVFVTLGWFSSNKLIGASSGNVKIGTDQFDIATKGRSEIRYSELIRGFDSGYDEGTETMISETTYHAANTKDRLMLRFDTDVGEISPGGKDSLNLYIIPKSNSAQNFKVTLNVVPFGEIEKKVLNENTNKYDTVYKIDENTGAVTDEPETVVLEIGTFSEMRSEAPWLSDNEINSYIDAARYIKGHIMFFGGEGDTDSSTPANSRFHHSIPYSTRTFTQSIESGQKGKAIPVPIYWMWPNILGQIVLPDNTSGNMKNYYPVVSNANTSEKALLTTYLKTYKSEVFTAGSSVTDAKIEAASQSNTFVQEDYNVLSESYDNADLAIGTYISYFMIEVTIESAS